MCNDAEFLSYTDEEAHIVRRLGAAVVCLWRDLPEDVREGIVRKSLNVHDAYQTVQLNEQIRRFIAENAGKR